jgi:hypothetical protein
MSHRQDSVPVAGLSCPPSPAAPKCCAVLRPPLSFVVLPVHSPVQPLAHGRLTLSPADTQSLDTFSRSPHSRSTLSPADTQSLDTFSRLSPNTAFARRSIRVLQQAGHPDRPSEQTDRHRKCGRPARLWRSGWRRTNFQHGFGFEITRRRNRCS